MALLDDVKLALRVTTNAYDTELNGLIAIQCRGLTLCPMTQGFFTMWKWR